MQATSAIVVTAAAVVVVVVVMVVLVRAGWHGMGGSTIWADGWRDKDEWARAEWGSRAKMTTEGQTLVV